MTDRRLRKLAQRLEQAAHHTPTIRHELNNQLAQSDTNHHNETGIITKGTINDPVINTVLKRSHILDAINTIDHTINTIDQTITHLEHALRTHRPPPTHQADTEPHCYIAGCDQLVSSYRRTDGSEGYRMGGELGGMCDRHRMQHHRTKQDGGPTTPPPHR